MALSAERSEIPAKRPTAFPTTQWSLVLQAGDGTDAAARTSLEDLCRRYWYPLYHHLRRRGHNHHAAEDLTQGFFAKLLASERLAKADPKRGRFRCFLLTALDHFAISEWRHAHAAIRGGRDSVAPLALPDAAERFSSEPIDPELTPEAAFDRTWALTLIRQGVEALKREYAESNRAELFAALLPHAFGEAPGEAQATAAARLGLNEHAFAVALCRFRRRLRERLRALACDTLIRPTDTDDELKVLLNAIRPAMRTR